MVEKLIKRSIHEAENPIEITLREAFCVLEPKLRPPFPLTIPTQEGYTNLNSAILYGILCEPHMAKVHVKHLHGIITDGYEYFTSILVKIVIELYGKLVDSVKRQLIWVTHEMVDVSAVGYDGLLVALLRQIVGGDFGEENLWLCFEMVNLFSSKWVCLLEEVPLVLSGALYVFLRLLADHCRVMNIPKIESLRQMEIAFCVRMLRENFSLCLRIGRDLVRLLQDLVHVPEFRSIWKDLLYNPSAFKVDGFVDISQMYGTRTSRWYFLLRITPEMESQLRFLLTRVKFGSQKRYQVWFARKFLAVPERKGVVIDIVRFICCAHHPSNEIIHSDIIPRWAVIGWLLKYDLKHYVEANLKLALFYDWIFFDEKVDNIMNIEPAVLLMVHSIPRYIDITHSLLEFLFILLDNYDVERKEIVSRGISTALHALTRKGVVQSLDVLTSCDMLSPIFKERLGKLLSDWQFQHRKEFQSTNIPPGGIPSSSSSLESQTSA
ncbi:integrator complex subunit 3 isoform X1 [Sesamum indicum]|uniref:Integrator complex subunit 3 isoform X1 n=3 Tax=Sesamum indicum TaxID=4182 RepID=A0A8M8UV10_SESIN|nr:integrator complex subunit 3 isoform X1 [Sesamum indicum]XP_020547669.1 integrator complex subunit 3 isoform X1 [Sesamum indicum]XP_020547670.1 integrator complex subunit 3 isoform X1 [Sesamum indicum]XP_020547671.1 integrator complex subunit 3 isoform X1 [Sesamum indicum]